MMTNIKPADLYERAVAYLLQMPKTEKQMRQWYARKTTDQNLVDEQIARLQEYNLLNDQDYADAYVQCKQDKLGIGLIKNKLRLNGVAPALIDQALANIGNQTELARLQVAKYLRHKDKTPETKAKVFRWLLSKGFDYELCSTVINDFWREWN